MIEENDNPSKRILSKLNVSGKTIEDCGRFIGISSAWMRDLLDNPEEIEFNLSIGSLQRLGEFLSCTPDWIITGKESSHPRISSELFESKLSAVCESEGIPNLEDKIGYMLKSSDGKWIAMDSMNLEMLRAICDIVGINWEDVL